MNALGRHYLWNILSRGMLLLLVPCSPLHASVPTSVIPQIPLIIAIPAHPQVLFLLPNSQSMDGNLSGAIMTGSGSLATGLSSLNSSSSPVNYTVPAGFIPPLQAANGAGQAPYSVLANGNYYDNGPSRLNMAKAGITAILKEYMASTDFALATYNTSGVSIYNTWVYYMSVAGANFTFTNTLPAAGTRYVNNPCFNYTSASTTVSQNCTSMSALYGASALSSHYMIIGASSDDSSINDVLYSSGSLAGIFVTYTGPSPASPYPPNYSLANYNNGNISLSYSKSAPNVGSFATSPTNAGYVPYSPQVIYARRGFGYYGSQTANSGTVVVPMTTAGATPTNSSIATAINTFSPYLAPESNSTSTTEIKASAIQAPTAGLLKQANAYMNPLGSTSGSGCPQKKYVVLVSDGLPTEDLSGKFWPPLGTASASGYGVSATFNADGSLNTTNDQALTDAISSITTLKNNGIATYIIGLGAGVDASLNPQAAATLTAMAVAGGTGSYYPASSATALTTALNSILLSIQSGNYSASAAAVNSTSLNGSTVEYQASFISYDSPYLDWTGNVQAIPLDPSTGVPSNTVVWSAQSLLDNLVSGSGWSNARIIATWDPIANTGVPFEWANINAVQQGQLQPTDALGSSRLNYLRGNTALETRNGGTFRNRSHILGDIINSEALYVGVPNDVYNTASYASFINTYQNRTPLLYVGSNDGMLHAFNATTGVEAFAFIPNAVFANLVNLSSTVYNQSHLFFVDGSPQSKDVQFADSSWHTVLVGGENAGGSSVYALDITSPANLNAENTLASAVLWEFTDGDMGLSYSQPQIAQINAATVPPANFAVFFGNGYNSPTNQAVLYAINPQTGAVIQKINLCTAVSGACDATKVQGLSSVAVANSDGLQGEAITNVYAGDLQGNLWSVNVTDSNPANWTVRLLFQAKDAGGTAQAITTAPAVSLHPIYPRKQGLFVLFGTGELLTANDLLTTQTQTIYGVWDKPGSTATYTRADLQSQTLTQGNVSGKGVLVTTSNGINWNAQAGWYSDMITAGQRIITNPDLINGTFIAVLNTPPLSLCGTSFSSMLLELNYANGGSFLNAQLDINGDGTFTSADTYNGLFVVGVGLLSNYSSAAKVMGPNSNNQLAITITHSDGTQSTIYNPNNNPRKVGWWEIQ